MKVVVALPAWNEAANLPFVIGELRERVRLPDTIVEYAVVDDGSTDATSSVARDLGCAVVALPFQLGYGGAFQTCVKFGLLRKCDVLVTFDADGQHDPGDVAALVDAVVEGADLVLASRSIAPGAFRGSRVRQVGRRLFAIAARAITGLPVSDPTSGMKALGPRAQRLFAAARFPDRYPDADALILAHRARLVVAERPSRMRPSRNRHSMHSPLRAVAYTFNMVLSLAAAATGRSSDLEGEA